MVTDFHMEHTESLIVFSNFAEVSNILSPLSPLKISTAGRKFLILLFCVGLSFQAGKLKNLHPYDLLCPDFGIEDGLFETDQHNPLELGKAVLICRRSTASWRWMMLTTRWCLIILTRSDDCRNATTTAG
jgi:hypothetical protein